GFELVGEASSGEETVEIVRAAHPDLLLLDLSMPRRSGLEALRELHEDEDVTRTIILSGTLDKPELVTAIQLGARGVVRKDAVSGRTVNNHLTRIFDKVGVANRAELAFTAARHGLVN